MNSSDSRGLLGNRSPRTIVGRADDLDKIKRNEACQIRSDQAYSLCYSDEFTCATGLIESGANYGLVLSANPL